MSKTLLGIPAGGVRRLSRPTLVAMGLACALGGSLAYSETILHKDHKAEHPSSPGPSLSVDLVNTTQGTFWPPATVADANGDFILVGTTLEKREGDEAVRPYPFQAVIVSKNTVPPLDANGREDFSNPFAAPYKIVRQLDLSPGSADLDMPLYTQSYGPTKGNFGGGGRSPKLGDSLYNLNALGGPGWEQPCPEMFPASSQQYTYTQDSRPLWDANVPGFKGDQVSHDVDTGQEFVPTNKNGAGCPAEGCLGEDRLDTRRTKPITLGEFLNQKANVTVELTQYSPEQQAYTAARFTVVGRDLLPNAIYQIVIGHSSFLGGRPLLKLAHTAALPGIIVTDHRGRGSLVFERENPFPDPAVDDAGTRVLAIGFVLRSDYVVAGMCNFRFAPGVDIHAFASTIGDGNPDDFDQFITKAPLKK